jgi:hypothetical protein
MHQGAPLNPNGMCVCPAGVAGVFPAPVGANGYSGADELHLILVDGNAKEGKEARQERI